MTLPHIKNFCGGNFQDWLEVMLENKCNGNCFFCIEKNGFKPKTVDWSTLASKILKTNKKNILLLGGEPTLYPDLKNLIQAITYDNRNVYITTNGGKLMNENFAEENLSLITGINISIHHYDLERNKKITGIDLIEEYLVDVIKWFQSKNITVRINCNCIAGEIDSKEEILEFIDVAKSWEVNSVRFAELKNDDRFVDLAKIFEYEYGLNDDPFMCGCHQNTIINGMPINFRQLCGMQTNKRAKPVEPKQILKDVLYCDGNIYKGWQTIKKEKIMSKKSNKEMREMLEAVLEQVALGDITVKSAAKCLLPLVMTSCEKEEVDNCCKKESTETGSGCAY